MGPGYGTLKLGLDNDKPEFSNFSWFAMLFGSAIAAGIVFWGPAEPAYHYMSPPPYFGGEALTPANGANAMTYSFFHWGLSAWSIYAMLTVALGHACFTKNLPLKFSSAFYYVIGDKIHGTWGKVLDIFAVFATLGGLATTNWACGTSAFQWIKISIWPDPGAGQYLYYHRRAYCYFHLFGLHRT